VIFFFSVYPPAPVFCSPRRSIWSCCRSLFMGSALVRGAGCGFA
jgi:hypothetical protein